MFLSYHCFEFIELTLISSFFVFTVLILPMIYFTLNELKINNNTILFIKQLAREYNKKRKTMAKPEA